MENSRLDSLSDSDLLDLAKLIRDELDRRISDEEERLSEEADAAELAESA